MTADDQHFMEIALRLGRRNRGATAENPSVGCVIVSGDGAGRMVGRGWTQAGGRPHAETVALDNAGKAARGATAYVTLEPCAHHGKTPPCADALIAAGIARLVAAIEDPDPRVAGGGLARLREAGVAVAIGPGADAARRDLAGFLMRMRERRPFVTLKLAVSSDGKIARAGGETTEITGQAARAFAHLLRARSDAILVGKGTVLADNPQLTCRLPGLGERSPLRVVLDTALDIPLYTELVRHAGEVPVRIYCRPDPPDDRARALERAGVVVRPTRCGPAGRPDIAEVLRDLAEIGINDLMVEGGAEIAAAFLEAGLVDRCALIRAPGTIGPGGIPALAHMPIEAITDAGPFARRSGRTFGEDVLDWYVRKE